MFTFFENLGLLEIDGYRYERPLAGGQAASIAIYRKIPHIPSFLSESPDRVAVKFLIAPRLERELETFRREAETLLMLRKVAKSPTLVKALSNVRSIPDLPVHYFFMEFVEGQTLSQKLKETPAPWSEEEALDLLKRVTMALIPAAANAQVHRDLHPGNIMVSGPVCPIVHPLLTEDPGIRILDFGVGRNWLADRRDNWQEDRFRHPGAVSSWSPELLKDPSSVDSKHDVWALGNLLFRLLTGEFAFFSEHFSDYYERVIHGQYNLEVLKNSSWHVRRLLASMFQAEPRKRISLGGVLKITTDICDRGLQDWLKAHAILGEMYFQVEGNIWTCPLCNATSNPTPDSRCRSCGRYVEEFLLPFAPVNSARAEHMAGGSRVEELVTPK